MSNEKEEQNQKINFDELESVVVNEESITFKCKNNPKKTYESKENFFGTQGIEYLYDFIKKNYFYYKNFTSVTRKEFEYNINDTLKKIFGESKELINLFTLLKKNLSEGFMFSAIQIPLDDIEFNEQEKEWFKDQNINTREELYEEYQTKDRFINFFTLYQTQKEAKNEDVKKKLTSVPFMIHYGDCCYDFDFSRGLGKFVFTSNIFTNEIHWQHKTFSNHPNFEGNLNIIFDKAIFLEKPHFSHATFDGKVDFLATRFKKGVSFYNTKFKQKADFRFSNFEYVANFKLANFTETFFFKHINPKIEKEQTQINYNHVQLDLKSAIIEKMDWEDTKLEVKDVANRETFLVLKQIAIKQNDNISALEFHTKEMDKYYSELEFCKNLVDKILLLFEKMISGYGTKPFRALICLLLFNFLFFIGLLFFQNEISLEKSIFKKIWLFIKSNPTYILGILIPFKAKIFTWFYFLPLIINPLLLYEIIKSFRKYSRKL